MKVIFERLITQCTAENAELSVEMIGERPCAGKMNEQARNDQLFAL